MLLVAYYKALCGHSRCLKNERRITIVVSGHMEANGKE